MVQFRFAFKNVIKTHAHKHTNTLTHACGTDKIKAIAEFAIDGVWRQKT